MTERAPRPEGGDPGVSITVRDATPADLDGLVPLLATLGYGMTPAAAADRLAALAAEDPGGRLLVAEVAGELHGFATLHVTPVLHRATGVGRVTGIAVLPAAQGTGVGRRLMEAAEAHFRALGLCRVEVTSGPMHLPAHDFYRRLGYADQGVRFAKPLAP